VRPDRDLFEHANAGSRSVGRPHDLLNVEVFGAREIEFSWVEGLAADLEFTDPRTLFPLRVAVPQPLHLETQTRLERDGPDVAFEGDEVEFASRGEAGTWVVTDSVPGREHFGVRANEITGNLVF
jgi:hypothetical protein